jgi:hypothetical protein
MAEPSEVPLLRRDTAIAIGNNVAWLCVCTRNLPLIGSTLIADDVRCDCGRRYRVCSVDGKKGSKVAQVEQVDEERVVPAMPISVGKGTALDPLTEGGRRTS